MIALLTLFAVSVALAQPNTQNTAKQIEDAILAESSGDLERAESILRSILEFDPNNQDAYETLVRICELRKPSASSPALDKTLAALPSSFRRYEASRFIVLSDTDPAWSREQLNRLERTYHQFMRFCRRLELQPLPLQHKLVCVLFDNRETYKSFAREHDDVISNWIAGYYAPAADRIVFYNIKSNPSVAEANQKLDEMQSQINDVHGHARDARRRGRADEAASLSEPHHQHRDHIQRERERVEAFTRRVSASTTTHEATHMLLFHTRIQTPRVQYPLWICEGLATNFETDDDSRSFGPDCDHAPRRERFSDLFKAGQLLSLNELIQCVDLPANDDGQRPAVVYHQSYAFVQWLCRFRRQEMINYLQLMRAQPPGRPTPQQHRDLFISAFGNIESLEAAWLRHERDRSG